MNKIDLMPKMEGEPLEVKEPSEEELKKEKEAPSESPTEEKPADDLEGDQEKKPQERPEGEAEPPEGEPEISDDAKAEKEVRGLKAQEDKLKVQLRENIVALRAQRRQIKTEAPSPHKTDDEDLGDIDPDLAKQMDGFLSKRGYAPKEQLRQEIEREGFFKEAINADEKFYQRYPEYLYSSELRNEFDSVMETMPQATDTKKYQNQLEIAHNTVKGNHPDKFPASSGDLVAQKLRLASASRGMGGRGLPSSLGRSSLTPDERADLRRGGWTEQEIKEINKDISEERL